MKPSRIQFLTRRAVLILLLAAMTLLAPRAAALDLDDVIRLKRSGVSEETILRVVEDAQAIFRLSVDDILDLRDEGCSDDLIRALMDTPERFGTRDRYLVDDDFDDDDYASIYDDDYTTVFVHHYYDPFAYHWYAWPTLYVYYSPFWWNRAGFYYAGHWSWDWWDPWGPANGYCNAHWGYHHHFGPSRTRTIARRPWHHDNQDAAVRRMHREATLYRRADLDLPAQKRLRASGTSISRGLADPTVRRAPDATRRAVAAAPARARAVAPAERAAQVARTRGEAARPTYRRGAERAPTPAAAPATDTRTPGRSGTTVTRDRSATPAPAPAPTPTRSGTTTRSEGSSRTESGRTRTR